MLSIKSFLEGIFSKNKKCFSVATSELVTEFFIRELALNISAQRISALFSRCNLKFYQPNEEKRDEWYRWNIKPNPNQSASDFWSKFIYYYCTRGEVLVIPINKDLYIADYYYLNETDTLFPQWFESVQIGELSYERRFYRDKVFFFRTTNKLLVKYLNSSLGIYGRMLNSAYNDFVSSRGLKGILKIDQFAEQSNNFEENMNDLMNKQFKTFFENNNAVLPLYTGYDFDPLTSNKPSTSEEKELIQSTIDLATTALGLPASLIKGEVADSKTGLDNALLFALDPICQLIQDELNAQLYSKQQVINGYHVVIDTTAVKHIDMFDVAEAVDKLIADGVMCVNEIRIKLGLDVIDEPWAWEHFITKNYTVVEERSADE